MKTGLLAIILFLLIRPVLADELNGTFTENGSKDTYTVNIQNDLGHVYTGTASELSNGKMTVNVSDGAGESYIGVATDSDEDDVYDLELKNPKTGALSSGTVDVDEF